MIDYKEAVKSIKNNISNLYILKGDDQYLQTLFIEKLYKEYSSSGNVEKKYLIPSEMSGKHIINELLSNDLFGIKKIFVVRDTQQFKGNIVKEFLECCAYNKGENIIVVIIDDFLSKASVSKHLNKIQPSINTQTPSKANLFKSVTYFFKEHSKSVNIDVIDMLIDSAGDSIGHLKNEVDLICLSNDSESLITMDHLQNLSNWDKERKRWEFIIAVSKNSLKESLKLSSKLFNQNETLIGLIYPLTSLFNEFLLIKLKNGTKMNNNSYIPLPPSVKNNIKKLSRNFKSKEIINALKLLIKIEKNQKKSKINDHTELTYFLFNVLKK